jgi:predicted kinase
MSSIRRSTRNMNKSNKGAPNSRSLRSATRQIVEIDSDNDSADDSIEVTCVKNVKGNLKSKSPQKQQQQQEKKKARPKSYKNKTNQRRVNNKSPVTADNQSQYSSSTSGLVSKPSTTTNHYNDNDPRMILLVGIPGSGKSTFADNLVSKSTNPDKFVRISQDQLKTRKKCEKKCREALTDGKIPIIDRCNFNKDQRKHFIDIASEFDIDCYSSIDCVFFDYNKQVCMKRCEERENHETLGSVKAIRMVVPRMSSMMRAPVNNKSSVEKFRVVTVVKSIHESNATMLRYAK